MKMTVKSCHFYDFCQRLKTWELKRTIIENKRTSKKLSLNKNLPVRGKKKPNKKQNLSIVPLESVVLPFHTEDFQFKKSSFTSKPKVSWLLSQAANLKSRRPELGSH